MTSSRDDLPIVHPPSRVEWRRWLRAHHAVSRGVWLVIAKKNVDVPGVTYTEAVEEALCFGWIDGQTRAMDASTFRIRMTPRKPRSMWARSNKARVRQLIREGRMTAAGLSVIEAARRDGSWMQLEAAERGGMPDDLRRALKRDRAAMRNFQAWSESAKKQVYSWISSAKRAETRSKRIAGAVRRASQNMKLGDRRP